MKWIALGICLTTLPLSGSASTLAINKTIQQIGEVSSTVMGRINVLEGIRESMLSTKTQSWGRGCMQVGLYQHEEDQLEHLKVELSRELENGSNIPNSRISPREVKLLQDIIANIEDLAIGWTGIVSKCDRNDIGNRQEAYDEVEKIIAVGPILQDTLNEFYKLNPQAKPKPKENQ